MAEGVRPALGLSVGATNLAAVSADHALTRKPVLTLYRQRPPEVGVPSENPRLDEPGLVITDFVNRVGDPVGIVAADGSTHRSEALVADGLRALAYAATGGRILPESAAVTYPAHWGSQAVDALGSELSRVAEWSNRARPLVVIPDAAATLFAVRANPGIPARGTVVLCDFGGSGTSITLMDAAGDYRPVAPTVRHHDFSGDLIDQALLAAVMANLPATGSFDPSGTSAIGSLSRLRAGCRSAKEQLSSSTVTTLSDELPGVRGDIRLTRDELDDAIRDSLNNFVAVLDETLARNGIRDLVTVVSVGGGANIPAVTTKLSGHLRVPIVTTPRPQLTAAIGAALRAARGPGDTSPTALTPAAPQTGSALTSLVPEGEKAGNTDAPLSGAVSTLMPVLAWSETDDSRVMPVGTGEHPKCGGRSGYTSARPALNFERKARPRSEKKDRAHSVVSAAGGADHRYGGGGAAGGDRGGDGIELRQAGDDAEYNSGFFGTGDPAAAVHGHAAGVDGHGALDHQCSAACDDRYPDDAATGDSAGPRGSGSRVGSGSAHPAYPRDQRANPLLRRNQPNDPWGWLRR